VWKESGTFAIFGLGILTIVLGCLGFEHLAAMRGLHQTFFDYLYMTLKMFPINTVDEVPPSIWELQIARFLAPAFTFLALFKLISVFFSERIQQFRLRFVRDHVIVCGTSPMGLELVKNFRTRGWPVVIIEPATGSKEIETARELGAFVVPGDPTAEPAQRIARVARARYLFAVNESDSLNSEIAMVCRAVTEADTRGHNLLTCFVHIVDPELCSLMQEQQLGASNERFSLELINIFQIDGLHLLKDYPPFPVQPTAPEGNVVIVGAGLLGESLIYHAVRLWREVYGDAKKLRIALIEPGAAARADLLRSRYPAFGRYCDLVPVDADPAAADFAREGLLFEGDRTTVMKVYVCLEDQSLGLGVALKINKALADFAVKRRVSKPAVPIIVRVTDDGLTRLFGHMGRSAGSFGNLCGFPLITLACNIDYITGGLNETIAMAIHEDYAIKKRKSGEDPATNPSVRDWDDLPETLKVSNRSQAIHIHQKIEAIGCEITRASDWEDNTFDFTAEEVEMLAEMEHERFVKERQRQGWKYGPTRDVDKKITPYLVPYRSLSEDVRELDRNSIRALPEALAQADLKIIRIRGSGVSPELWTENELVVR
jgi:hypothetical protein